MSKLVDRVGFEPTTFRVRAEYSNPVELPIHKLTWAGYLVVMRPLRIFYTRKKRISSLDPYGTDWIFHTPLKIGGSGGYCPHTNILIKSQMPVYCSFTCIKKLYLLLSTNYNHLTTLYPPVNNVLKKKYSEQINFIWVVAAPTLRIPKLTVWPHSRAFTWIVDTGV